MCSSCSSVNSDQSEADKWNLVATRVNFTKSCHLVSTEKRNFTDKKIFFFSLVRVMIEAYPYSFVTENVKRNKGIL